MTHDHRHRLLFFLAVVTLLTGPTSLVRGQYPYEIQWGSSGSQAGQFDAPGGLSFDMIHAEVFVADAGNDRIQVFDFDGGFLREWGSTGSGPGQFQQPNDVFYDEWTDSVFVVDESSRVQRFSPDGTYQLGWGGPGNGNGQFNTPRGITVDGGNGNVYVVDTNNHRIQKFDTSGTFLLAFGTQGSGNGELQSPQSAVAWENQVWVADTGNHRIQVLDANGAFLNVWGSVGSGPAQFIFPRGIAMNCQGHVFVADTENDRVQVFDYQGNYMTQFGSTGTGDGQFDSPVDVGLFAFSSVVGKKTPFDGLFVLDAGNDRVQRFDDVCCQGGFGYEGTVSSAGGRIMITPGGNGPTLASVDATVTVTLLDTCEEPIVGFPFQDIWLDDIGNGDVWLCQGGSVADGNTNGSGTTTISGIIAGGGFSQAGMRVYLAGIPQDPILDIFPVSPDITGDREVNLSDVQEFAADYGNQTYDFRSDLDPDDIENLSDVAALALHIGETCP